MVGGLLTGHGLVGLWMCVRGCPSGGGLCSELIRVDMGGYRRIWRGEMETELQESTKKPGSPFQASRTMLVFEGRV